MKQRNKFKRLEHNVFILDACRYDDFKKTNFIKGTLEKVWSMGSKTPEFYEEIKENNLLSSYHLHSANPHKWNSDVFKSYSLLGKDLSTDKAVDPFYNLEEVRDELERDEPVLIHLVPPHLPWLSDEGKDRLNDMGYNIRFPREDRDVPIERKIYRSIDDARRLYRKNIEYALEAILENRDHLGEGDIITSDHGELFGEHGLYGHWFSDKLDYPEIREVPWLCIK